MEKKLFTALLLSAMLLPACDKADKKPACSPNAACFPIARTGSFGSHGVLPVDTWKFNEEGVLTYKRYTPERTAMYADSYYSYNADGKLTSLKRVITGFFTQPPSWEHVYTYDAEGRLTRRDDYEIGIVSPYVRYDDEVNGKNVYNVYEYDPSGRRTGMKTFRQDNTPVYPHETYEYDEKGNLANMYFKTQQRTYLAVTYSYDDKNSIYLREPDAGDSPVTVGPATVTTPKTPYPSRVVFPRSPHNVTQRVLFDSTGAVASTTDFTYQYNEQCFPVKRWTSAPSDPAIRIEATISYDCK